MLLQEKVAVITGAGSGMGRAMALRFAREGAAVAVADINFEAAEETVRLIQQQQFKAFPVQVDVSDSDSVKNMIGYVWDKEHRLDIVINNAGVPQAFTRIEELEEYMWDRIMNVNTKSVYLTAKYAVPYMKQNNQGVILNISSIASERARPGLNAYCASKGAVVVLTKALALELAPYGIRVNAINPGPANTEMLGKFIANAEEVEQQKKDVFLNSVPLGKLIEPEDIAESALYLCSPLADKVTGSIVNVDGGRGI